MYDSWIAINVQTSNVRHFIRRTSMLSIGLLALHYGSVIRRPQREVVADELHDEGGILVLILIESVEIFNCIIERFLRNKARFLSVTGDLVVKDAGVQRQPKPDGVCACQALCRVSSDGVSVLCIPHGVLSNVAPRDLSVVPVVISLHLQEEAPGLLVGGSLRAVCGDGTGFCGEFFDLGGGRLCVARGERV